MDVEIRNLARNGLGDIWAIDRAELVERIYHREGAGLVLEPKRIDVKGWPPGEQELYGPILLDCFDRGGTFYGAFDGASLIGLAVLESRFIGRARDQLQLKFMHVSRRYRAAGIGHTLLEKVMATARSLGARRLYISATPSENTVDFYLRHGARVTDDVDAALFALEPEDIHLELDLPARPGPAPR
jgi:predicted N-acetyltransferase YhbS